MKLRYIFISSNDIKHRLGYIWAGDFISDFMTDEVRKLRYELEHYNTISISLITDTSKVGCCYYEKDIRVNVSISDKEVEDYNYSMTDNERCEMLISLMAKGFRMAYGFDSTVPCDMLLSLLDDFRKAGYVNRWQFKRVQLKELNMVAELNCRFDINDFRMTLALVDKKTKNKNKEALIYRTPP